MKKRFFAFRRPTKNRPLFFVLYYNTYWFCYRLYRLFQNYYFTHSKCRLTNFIALTDFCFDPPFGCTLARRLELSAVRESVISLTGTSFASLTLAEIRSHLLCLENFGLFHIATPTGFVGAFIGFFEMTLYSFEMSAY